MAEGRRSWKLPRRAMNRAVRPYLADLQARLDANTWAIERLHGDLGRVHRELEEVNGRADRIETDAERAAGIARSVYDEEPANRRRLNALRASEEYELAFTEPEPLVSFLIPTYTSYETLRDVALPSILAQTYTNLEVIVVGDCAPPETERAITSIGDPRVSYFNRTMRGPYPEDPDRRWYVIGTPPYNEALARARGRWIAGLGDDDSVLPTHTEKLLAAARECRYEHCYGKQLVNFAAGEPMTLGGFPPALGEWGLQAALFHAGLRFFESELSDAVYEEPNDWSMCRRMMRAGVRIGMIDEVVVEKHETRRRSAAEWGDGSVPAVE
jgi:cellulose synthase/poly-beta-1,6-N-acetylglucosamine synthase-like glycosyltransferase